MENNETTFPSIINLNVGGFHYSTSLETLHRDPNSMLSAMFSGRLPTRTDQEGRFFIDRNGEVFGQILDYLRDTRHFRPPHDDLTRDILRKEADFYQLQGLLHLISRYEHGLSSPPGCYGKKMSDLCLQTLGRRHGEMIQKFIDSLKQAMHDAAIIGKVKVEVALSQFQSAEMFDGFRDFNELLAVLRIVAHRVRMEGVDIRFALQKTNNGMVSLQNSRVYLDVLALERYQMKQQPPAPFVRAHARPPALFTVTGVGEGADAAEAHDTRSDAASQAAPPQSVPADNNLNLGRVRAVSECDDEDFSPDGSYNAGADYGRYPRTPYSHRNRDSRSDLTLFELQRALSLLARLDHTSPSEPPPAPLRVGPGFPPTAQPQDPNTTYI
eukprot:GCRY01003135.1.p1 GENE.GCRY01003135.1~~GCRY01003135.1.p1  ORF type:complete len:383 (+),score=65.10 GCRY01003135.1:183-1331(+)